MRKIYLFMLMAVGLLISGNSWAATASFSVKNASGETVKSSLTTLALAIAELPQTSDDAAKDWTITLTGTYYQLPAGTYKLYGATLNTQTYYLRTKDANEYIIQNGIITNSTTSTYALSLYKASGNVTLNNVKIKTPNYDYPVLCNNTSALTIDANCELIGKTYSIGTKGTSYTFTINNSAALTQPIYVSDQGGTFKLTNNNGGIIPGIIWSSTSKNSKSHTFTNNGVFTVDIAKLTGTITLAGAGTFNLAAGNYTNIIKLPEEGTPTYNCVEGVIVAKAVKEKIGDAPSGLQWVAQTYDESGNVTAYRLANSNDEPVCKIGDNNYYTLQDAVDNATAGQTIELVDNVLNVNNNITISKGITLDIKNYTLSFASTYEIDAKAAGATVTITGDGGTISASAANISGAIYVTDGSLSIDNVTVNGGKYAINVKQATNANVQDIAIGGNVTLSNSVASADGGYPIYLQAKNADGAFTNNSQYNVCIQGGTPATPFSCTNLQGTGSYILLEASTYGHYSLDFKSYYDEYQPANWSIAEGCYFEHKLAKTSDTYQIVAIPNPVVATIDELPGNMYGTLKDAITAAQNGHTIKVLTSSNESWSSALKIVGTTKTIDFGESNAIISLSGAEGYLYVANTSTNQNATNLTIKGKGTITSDYKYGVIYANNAILNLTVDEGVTLIGTTAGYAVREFDFAKSYTAGHLTIKGNARVVFEGSSKLATSGLIDCAEGAGPIEFRAGTIYNSVYDEYKKYIYAGSKDTEGATYHTIALNSDPTNAFAIQGTKYYFSESEVNYAMSFTASSEPLKLLKDMTFDPYAARTSDLTLDLNGHDLILTKPIVLEGTNSRINFTITDSSEKHDGELIGTDHNTIVAYSNVDIDIQAGQVINRCSEGDPASIQTIAALDIEDAAKGVNITLDNTFPEIAASNLPRVDCTKGASIFVQSNSSITMKQGFIYASTLGLCNNGSDAAASTMTVSGGKIWSANGSAIYHPGKGTLTISGGELKGALTGVEIRAGVLNMTGGKVISTYEGSESESWGNGNGTTTVGAGIAVAQHTTKLPVTVTISGGDIDALIPVKMANPQGNPDEKINEVSVSINDGRYKVTNGASAPFWSVTDNFAVSAGKFSHVPAYVVEGKTVIPNTDDDKNIYPWTIGEVNTDPITPTGNITWQTNTDWPNDKVPTSQDKVTLSEGQNITVSGSSDEVAQAYSITIPTGSTLTVESGATLVVGGGGITNADGATGLQVEPGAQVIVSPDANMDGLYGRVALTPNVGKYPAGMSDFVSKPNRYQLVGIPTKGAPDAITKNKDDGEGFKLNQWDVEKGWQAANLDDFSVPFKGFFFWNDVAVNDETPNLVTYYFKGELFGNKPQTLVFTEHEGFHLFANSYLAEVDIMALIQGAEEDVQKAVYVYDPVSEKFTDISYATYGKPGIPSAIQPMQGFYFLNQHDANTTAPMDYVSMVWSNAFKVDQEFVPTNAPRKSAIDGSEVRINITDNVVGRTDGVYVMEDDKYSAELDASDVQKMMNPETSVNIYATTPVGNLSTMQTNDIENQYLTIETNAASMYTMSFDWVAGDELYLLDTYNGKTTLMTEGNTYEFAAQPKSIINDRFQIVKTAAQAPTTIENVKSIKAVKGTYTVTGQCLGENVDWNKLPQGVYVIDGVKVVK